MNKTVFKFFSIFFLLLGTPAWAGSAGAAEPWQFGLQEAASPVKEHVHDFHMLLMVILTGIVLLVTGLLLYVMLRYNEKANPEPAKFTHNVTLEMIWTGIPVLILFVIAVPSFRVMYYMDRAIEPEMTLKVTGYQWYWGYEYPDLEGVNFMSYMVPEDETDTAKGEKRLLETDTKVVLPVNTNIQILVTSADVLHSWAMPSFGIKTDAVPGQLNETWVRIDKPGTYYGQCSEICGAGHAYMPIQIRAVSKEDFEKWSDKAREQYAETGTVPEIELAQMTGGSER